MKILGIESSCDETAVSVVEDGRKILSNTILSQIDIHQLYGGVVPEIAARAHCEAISGLAKKAIREAGGLETIEAIAVTNAPGLIGALLVGMNFAKSLAFSAGKPLVPVHHLKGHVAANYITHPDLTPPFTALIASGGHSHIVEVLDYTTYKIIGHTRDDAAGEAFDKAARVLGLGYPGGAKMEELAKTGDPTAISFPKVHFPDSPYDFSFSGVKTAVINYIHTKKQTQTAYSAPNVAAAFTEAVCGVLTEKAVLAAEMTGCGKLVLAGGVGANSFLREGLENACRQKGIRLYLPQKALCGDNGAMIASQGYYEYLAGKTAGYDLNAYATMSIENA